MKHHHSSVVLAVFLCVAGVLVAPFGWADSGSAPRDIASFAHPMLKGFFTNDGLPQGSIIAIATDSSGRLWIGTQDGAAVYNGRKWTTVDMPNKTTSNYVQSIYVASDSALWFSTVRGGVQRYAHGTWQMFDTSNGLGGTVVRSILESTDSAGGNLYWFATDHGVSLLDRGRWRTFTTRNSGLPGDVANKLVKLPDGTLLCATNRGAARFRDGNWERVSAPKGALDTAVYSVAVAADGSQWFGGNGIVVRNQNGRWNTFRIESSLPHNRVNAIFESSRGEIWIGAESGILRLAIPSHSRSVSSLEYFVSESDLGSRTGDIFSIHETHGGILWFGTQFGLYRYIPGEWRSLNEETGLTNTAITYIYQRSNGDFFFGTPRGLIRFHNGRWKRMSDGGSLANCFVKAVLETRDGALWVGTTGNGAYRYADGRWKQFGGMSGLADDRVFSIAQSNDGSIWFATARGVSTYDRGRWTTLTTKDGLAGNEVMSVYQSLDGAMWFGTRSGVSRLFHGQWKSYTMQDGLASNVAHSINGFADGSLWFGTFSGGASRFLPATQRWTTFNETSSPRISNDVVYQVQQDQFGRLYFLTNKGVTRLTPIVSSLDSTASVPLNDRMTDAYKTEVFTTEDGLPDNEGGVRSSWVDARGRIWVGTAKGAAFFDPQEERADTVRKPLIMENILIPDLATDQSIKRGMELRYDENNISFEYALLSLFKERETKYRTRLVGYDARITNWTSDFRKEYTNLPSRKYTFQVWGEDHAGNVSGPLEFSFTILPPFWISWWFRGVLALLVVAVVVIIVRVYTSYNLRKQMALMEQQRLVERERYRISQDMHDTVGSSLTRIALLSDGVKIEMDKGHVQGKAIDGIRTKATSIGETAREVIDTMNEIIWSLSPRYDTLESLINYMRLHLNAMFESKTIQCTFDIQHSIPHVALTPDVRRNIFLIFKEAVNNLVKYSRATNVTIAVTVADQAFSLTIHDNGVGFSELESIGGARAGFGLVNMRERATALGATLDIVSEPGKGTTVRFIYPLDKSILHLKD